MQLTNLWSWLSGGQPRRSSQRRPRPFRPVLNNLEDRTVPAGYIATGAGLGAIPEVSIRVDIRNSLTGGQIPPGSGQIEPAESDGKTDLLSQVFQAYNPAFRGGVHVATGNFDGDYRTPDSLVTAPLSAGGPHVIVWRMTQLADGRIVTDGILDQFMAYDPRFGGGVNLTTGDLDGDGRAELITAPASSGGPHVKVYSFNTTTNRFELKTQFMAYDPIFQGGVSIASSQGYSTAIQISQVVSAQLPARNQGPPASNFAVVPYPPDNSGTPGNFPSVYIPLVGSNYFTLSDLGVTGNTLSTGPGSPTYFDSATPPAGLPSITVASGFIQYLSGNLLNSYAQLQYEPNVFDPLNNAPPNTQPLVFASWAMTDMNRPTFAMPDVVYGPFVQVSAQQGQNPPVITRLRPPSGQLATRNQLITGAGPGGGPHVRVFDFTNDAQGFRVAADTGFMAFDQSFSGGVDVALGDVVQFPIAAGIPTAPYLIPDTVGTPIQNRVFPYLTDTYGLFTPEIVVSMATGGNQSRIFGDWNPGQVARTSIDEIVFAPAILDTKIVPDLNNPLGGFQGIQDVTFFDQAIDPQFRGTIYSGVSGLTFSGAGTNALGQSIFAAGANPGNLPLRGPKVRIFGSLGPSLQAPGLIQQPIDDFQAFNIGSFPGGAGGVAFGFGVLPVPGVDTIELAPITVGTIMNPRLV